MPGVRVKTALLWPLCLDWRCLGCHSSSWLGPPRIGHRRRIAQRHSCYAPGSFPRTSCPRLGSEREASDPPASPASDPPPGSKMLLISLRRHLISSTAGGGSDDDAGQSQESGAIRLVLASQSPRRREILDMMGLEGRFVVVPSPADEAGIGAGMVGMSLDPPEYARRLASAKATALADRLVLDMEVGEAAAADPHAHARWTIVLGSDTIVDLDGHILEKPVDETDAGRMLSMLSGRRHSVHTGVALVCVGRCTDGDDAVTVTTTSFVDTAVVQFAALTKGDIEAYVSTGEPLDKAGSYGIQGIGGQMVRSIEGDFFTVMGLPMFRVSQALAHLVQELLED